MAPGVEPTQLSRFLPPPDGGRPSAVLALFGEGAEGPDLLLIQRASTMRAHAGQPAFPGGAIDPGDAGPAAAALREAQEEVGLDPAGVEVLATLPPIYLPPSGFTVHTVLGWWHGPTAVSPRDPAEVAAVERVPIAELTDPANRGEVTLLPGYTGPAFRVRGLLVWGFTAGLIDKIMGFAGWELPWGPGPMFERPAAPYDPAVAAEIADVLGQDDSAS